ncbi:MAG TPA: hypothetical protein VIZ17_19905 [Acetobacteraceae bacterium]
MQQNFSTERSSSFKALSAVCWRKSTLNRLKRTTPSLQPIQQRSTGCSFLFLDAHYTWPEQIIVDLDARDNPLRRQYADAGV